MPRSIMKKIDILQKVYKYKTELYDGTFNDKSGEWHEGSHHAYNRILELLNEYSN